ncbi:DUF5317 domain-containing protein [Halalkalibacter akibai]|uniref:DUF5317 domain-containing protein n=1 Tax=Halalkalibacter akibai (strain ATCC 43226 / DSM 21942 / CIP 109018 / JCM 9157 / 1139) TaxID=1236973 RepID=W4QPA1_HALA3|nr:DUF5317 domain-containing protein [Halalkalibacter akibai]GAE33747.1 hypothetical protein JCM9157_771 [Halalkalibacter akibai JCM 9157]
MVFDGILLSLIVGFLRRGTLRGLADLNLKYGWVFPILLGIQILVFSLQGMVVWLEQISGFLFILIYVLGLFFLWVNRENKGFVLLFVGVFLNFIVMALNGGRMPVSYEAAAFALDPYYTDILLNGIYGKHEMLTEATKLGFLGDIIPITSPYPKSQVISIGDVIMNIGVFIFIQHLMLKHKRVKPAISKAVS